MSSSNKKIPPPESLRKKGITHVTDNIPEGMQLNVSGSLIFQLFSKELQERFVKGGRYGQSDESAGSGPGK